MISGSMHVQNISLGFDYLAMALIYLPGDVFGISIVVRVVRTIDMSCTVSAIVRCTVDTTIRARH